MTRHNDWDHLDNAPFGIIPPGMPDSPRFPDAALRYGSPRDIELTERNAECWRMFFRSFRACFGRLRFWR